MGDTRGPPRTEPRSPALAIFERALQTTQNQLLGFLRNLAGDDEEARDLLQEVYIAAWRAAEQGKPPFTAADDEAACRRWLFHVAYCRVISALRRRSLIAWESLDPIAGSSSVAWESRTSFEELVVEGDSLRQALNRLDPGDVACLLLRVVEGFSATEIAQVLDTSPEAARKRLSRAMRRLRAAYFSEEEFTP